MRWAVDTIARGIRPVVTGSTSTPILDRRSRASTGLWMRLALLLPFLVFVLFPFYWIITTSLKSTAQISARTSIFWPEPATLDQYSQLLWHTPFLTWLMNSAFVAAASTVVSVALAALAAYALSRLKFVGAGLLTTLLLITYLLPGTLLFIPLYQTLSRLA